MASTTTTLTDRDAYRALETHHAKVAGLHLRDLFAEDGERGTKLTAEGAGLYLDYSKHRLTDETVGLLVALAEDVGLSERIEAMFRGDRINVTENRSVLHTALRLPRDASLVVDGQDVVAEVHDVLDRMADFSRRVRGGEWTGHTGKRIRNVVNIGIGGSDLGPVMAYEALRHYSVGRCLNCNLARTQGSIRHRIHCIRHQVQYDLLQVHWVGPHPQVLLDALYAQVSVSPVGLGRKNLHRIRDHGIKIAVSNVALALEEIAQVPDDIHGEVVRLPDVGHRFPCLRDIWRVKPEQLLRPFRIEINRYQRLTDLVCEGC